MAVKLNERKVSSSLKSQNIKASPWDKISYPIQDYMIAKKAAKRLREKCLKNPNEVQFVSLTQGVDAEKVIKLLKSVGITAEITCSSGRVISGYLEKGK